MPIPGREVKFSPFGGPVTRSGVTVDVKIYRLVGTDDEWTLEIVDNEGSRTVFNGTFSDDVDAYETFEAAVAEHGIGSFSDSDEDNH